MKISSVVLDSHDINRLKQTCSKYEAEIAKLDEQQLDQMERELEGKLRQLYRPKIFESLRRRRFGPKYLGLGVGAMAAAVLMLVIRPPSSENTWQTKGMMNGKAKICELTLVAADRTDFSEIENGFVLPKDQAVYPRVSCSHSAFVHVLVESTESSQVLAFNQKIDRGYSFLSNDHQLKDLRPFRGGVLKLWSSDTPLNSWGEILLAENTSAKPLGSVQYSLR